MVNVLFQGWVDVCLTVMLLRCATLMDLIKEIYEPRSVCFSFCKYDDKLHYSSDKLDGFKGNGLQLLDTGVSAAFDTH